MKICETGDQGPNFQKCVSFVPQHVCILTCCFVLLVSESKQNPGSNSFSQYLSPSFNICSRGCILSFLFYLPFLTHKAEGQLQQFSQGTLVISALSTGPLPCAQRMGQQHGLRKMTTTFYKHLIQRSDIKNETILLPEICSDSSTRRMSKRISRNTGIKNMLRNSRVIMRNLGPCSSVQPEVYHKAKHPTCWVTLHHRLTYFM